MVRSYRTAYSSHSVVPPRALDFQPRVTNAHLLLRSSGGGGAPSAVVEDPHAAAGVDLWPADPPILPPPLPWLEAEARWLVHYDNLHFNQPKWLCAVQYASTVRGALSGFLTRRIRTYQGPSGPVIDTAFASITHVIGIQPLGTPFLRILLPSDLFLARDAGGNQTITPLLPPATG